jgi:hypothetical protein
MSFRGRTALAVVASGLLMLTLWTATTPAADPEEPKNEVANDPRPTPAWPPRFADWAREAKEKSAQKAAPDLQLHRVDERWAITVTTDRKRGYFLYLLTAVAFSDDGFLGCHQRFEEDTGGSGQRRLLIPDLPSGTTKVIVKYRPFAFDREQWSEDKMGKWYSFTWARFTTVARPGGDSYCWRFTDRLTDTDLAQWLRDSKAIFKPEAGRTVAVDIDR